MAGSGGMRIAAIQVGCLHGGSISLETVFISVR